MAHKFQPGNYYHSALLTICPQEKRIFARSLIVTEITMLGLFVSKWQAQSQNTQVDRRQVVLPQSPFYLLRTRLINNSSLLTILSSQLLPWEGSPDTCS